jgi:hypothetical protein
MKAHKLDGSQLCPNCLARLDGATNATGSRAPGPGDVTICIYCQAPLIFSEGLNLRPLTQDDVQSLPVDLTRQLAAIQKAAGAVRKPAERNN